MEHAHTDMRPVVALDIGNTAVKVALLADGEWRQLLRVPTLPTEGLADRLTAAVPQERAASLHGARCVACSVQYRANAPAEEFCRSACGARALEFFRRDIALPITICVREPETVGTDRLLLALGARGVAGAPCIVASAGTAITVDLLDADGCFAGGAIAPGFGLSATALHRGTAALPLVEPAAPEATPGRMTSDAIRNGVYWSCVGGVRALVQCYREALGRPDAPVVCTGGDAALLMTGLDDPHAAHHPHLILRGMAEALSQQN